MATEDIPRSPTGVPRRPTAVGLILAALLALAIILVASTPLDDWLASLPGQASRLGIWAPVAIIGLFYVFTVAALPTPLLVAASGATLGLWIGFVGIWLGYLLAAGTVWAISRSVAAPMRARLVRLHPDADRLLDAIADRGSWLVFLTQLHPLSPNGIFNWLYPSLGIQARHALPAIGLGRAPTLWLYTALGAWSVEGLAAEGGGWWWLVAAIAAIAVFAAIGRLVSRALREATAR